MIVVGVRKLIITFIKERPIYFLAAALFLICAAAIPYFLTPRNLTNILYQSSDLIIVASGLTFVLLNGGIDFSITAVLGLASITGALLMNLNDGLLMDSPFNVPLTVMIMICIGLFIGTVNGIAVAKLKMPSFIATISTNLIFSGLSLALARSRPVSNLPASFKAIGNTKIFEIPVAFLIAVAVVLILNFLLGRTIFGKYVYSIGTNMKTSLVTGLPVRKTIFFLFLISSGVASLGAIVSTARIGVGMPALGAERFIDFISAVVLGGTSIFGGAGTIIGTMFGALFVAILSNALSMLGLQWYFIMVAKGVIILIIAAFDAVKRFGN